MGLDPSVLVPVAVVLVLLLGGGIAVVGIMMAKKKGQLLDAWAHAAYSIWTGGEDSATWAADRAQTSFKNWYGAASGGQAQNTIAEVMGGQTGNLAWDNVRALDLVRMGLAAGYLDQDQVKTYQAKIGNALQRRYGSWEQLAQDFEAGMRAWHQRMGQTNPQETERVQRNLPKLRAQIWPKVPFTATLVAPD